MNRITEKFKVITEDGLNVEMTLELGEYTGFQYGNMHTVTLYEVWDGGKTQRSFDARYDHRFDTEELFRKNAFEFVKENVRETCKVEKLEGV